MAINMGGHIRLSRDITEWGWYKDSCTFRVFFHLLMKANWKEGEYMGHKVERGSLVTGRKQLALELGLSERNVRTAIDHLKSTNELTIKSTNKFSIITICKYERWVGEEISADQQNDQQNDQQPTNNRPTTDQQPTTIEENNKDNKEKRDSKEENKKNAEIEDFVNRIYAMYPSKCPVRNTPLGKSGKDKDRIRKLLKTYSKEDIEKVVKHEVEEKYGKHMMQNFSSFLNNFPDPESLFGGNISGTVAYPRSVDDVKADDVNPNWDIYCYWAEKSGAYKLYDNMNGGFPENDRQYQYMLEHTIGGARAFAYVVLVFMRDGWKEYDDERGFMWIYSNYIKANGLYKE